MAKNFRRMFAMVLVLCMTLSALPMQALAAEDEGTTGENVVIEVKVETSAGTVDGTQTTTLSVSTTDTATGNTTTTSSTTTEAKDSKSVTQSNASGTVSTTVETKVEYSETKTESVVTNSNGDQIAESGSTEGRETVTETTTTTTVVEGAPQEIPSGDPVIEEVVAGNGDNAFGEGNDGTLTGSVGAGENKVQATPDLDEITKQPENVTPNEDGSWSESTTVEGTPVVESNMENPDVVTNADGSTTTTTTTTTATTDTTTTTTTTEEVVADRELITDGLETESEEIVDEEVTKGKEIIPVDGEQTPAEGETGSSEPVEPDWKDVDDTTIQMAKDMINAAEGEFVWPEGTTDEVKAKVEALVAAKDNEAVKALLGQATPEKREEITAEIKDVSLTVKDKVADDVANADEFVSNDKYNADLEFEIVVSKNILGTTMVTVMQGKKVLAKEYLSKWNPDVTETGANAYEIKLENLQLAEGEVNLDITLENVDEITTEKVFVATVEDKVTETVEVEVDKVVDYVPEAPDTSVNITNQTITDKENVNSIEGGWNGSDSFTYDVKDSSGETIATITVTPGEDDKLNIKADHTIEMNSIVLDTPFGSITYVPSGNMLVKDHIYTVDGHLKPTGNDGDGTASSVINNANQDKIQLQTAGNAQGKLSQIPDGDVTVIIDGVAYDGTMSGSGNTIALHTGNQRDNTLNFGDKVVIISKSNNNSVTVIVGKHESNPNQGKGTVVYSIAENKLGFQFSAGGIKTETIKVTEEQERTKAVYDAIVGTRQDKQNVSLNMGMSFNFAVNEAQVKTTTKVEKTETTTTVVEKIVETVRSWSDKFSKETPVEEPKEPVTPVAPVAAAFVEPAPQARVFRLNNQDNLVEIPEEPVPLATPVVTGDNSNLWIAVILMSVLCMVAINVFDKKHQHETF